MITSKKTPVKAERQKTHAEHLALSILENEQRLDRDNHWHSLAQSAALLGTVSPRPATNVDEPDPVIAERPELLPPDDSGNWQYDTRTETWFPITVNLPGNNGGEAAPEPVVDEKANRKELIMIFAIALVLLLLILMMLKKNN